MEIENYITALTNIDGLLWQVIGALKAELVKNSQSNYNTYDLSDKNCDIGFTEKEINSMPKKFRKQFRTQGHTAHIRRKQNSASTYSYEIRYRKNGYNISVCAKTLELAKQKFIETLAKTESQPKQLTTPTQFNDFATHYFETFYKDKVIATTYKNTFAVFERWVKPNFANLDIRKVTPGDCKRLLDLLKEKQLGKTSDVVHSILNQTFKMAIAYNLIQRNPLAIIPHKQHEKVGGVPLTKEEEKLLLTQCKPRYRFIFAIYLYCGLRPGEMVTATIEDPFIVSENLKRKDHKKAYKKIPITKMLRPYMESDIGKVPTREHVRAEFKRLLPNHSLKDCRITFSTRCQECGVIREVIKTWMGHAFDDVLGKNYTKFSDEFMLKEAEKILY